MTPALQRYRIASYTVGTLLLLLCAEVYANHVLDNKSFGWIGIVHGWFYMIYLVIAFNLYRRERWPARVVLAVVAAGLVPGMVFFVERRITQRAMANPASANVAPKPTPGPAKAAAAQPAVTQPAVTQPAVTQPAKPADS